MDDFCVRWGEDVQPYIMQLGSEHIDRLRRYCTTSVQRLRQLRQARNSAVIAVTARVHRRMMKATAFHCFEMFGFSFALREEEKRGRKQEFVLNFASAPDFEPSDIPPRLRCAPGESISARPRRKRRAAKAAVPDRSETLGSGDGRKREAERVATCRLARFLMWKERQGAVLASWLAPRLYKLDQRYRRLFVHLRTIWRRRPQIGLPFQREYLLTRLREFSAHATTRLRLEPRFMDGPVHLLLFTFVTREPAIDWDDYPFGRLADETERIPA